MKLLGTELRVADYAVDARLTRDRYRKSQTNQPVCAVFELMMRKQAGKSKSRIHGRVSHVRAHMPVDDELHRAITKLIAVDAVAIASQRFSTGILTLLWLRDSSVADTDTV
ncbi:MAG: hypothetical protein Q8T13_14210 [Acidobacteriota bacterium]|nr:hypothetical protein [Acidobacteriota bacterium]